MCDEVKPGCPTTSVTDCKPSGSVGAFTVKLPEAEVVAELVPEVNVAVTGRSGDRAGEGAEDLSDELRLGDLGVLITCDARIGGGGHLERGEDRRLEDLEPEILEEIRARGAVPEGSSR